MREAAALGERRARVLRAMGVSALRLRTRVGVTGTDLSEDMPALGGPPDAVCVVVLSDAMTPRRRDLLDRALHAFGPTFARAPRIGVSHGEPTRAVPLAQVYVALGQAQAQALGRVLSAVQLHAAQVLLVDAPEQLHLANGKRLLWQALKRARRSLLEVTDKRGA